MSDEQAIQDTATYREMSEPFAGTEELNDALLAFYEDLREIRTKHRLADVLVVVQDAYLDNDGQEIPALSRSNIGSIHNCLPMATWLYAKEQADHKRYLRHLMKQVEED